MWLPHFYKLSPCPTPEDYRNYGIVHGCMHSSRVRTWCCKELFCTRKAFLGYLKEIIIHCIKYLTVGVSLYWESKWWMKCICCLFCETNASHDMKNVHQAYCQYDWHLTCMHTAWNHTLRKVTHGQCQHNHFTAKAKCIHPLRCIMLYVCFV